MSDLKRHFIPTVYQATGKRYPALERDFDLLTPEAQQDLLRLVRELVDEKHRAEARARRGF